MLRNLNLHSPVKANKTRWTGNYNVLLQCTQIGIKESYSKRVIHEIPSDSNYKNNLYCNNIL